MHQCMHDIRIVIVYVCVSVCVYVHVCVNVYACVCVCLCMCVCVCKCCALVQSRMVKVHLHYITGIRACERASGCVHRPV